MGTRDAIVPTRMFNASTVQKLRLAPNASRHATMTPARSTAFSRLPAIISKMRRGERTASQMVAAALLSRGTTLVRNFGTNQITAASSARTATAMSTNDTTFETGISLVWMDVGERTTASAKTPI